MECGYLSCGTENGPGYNSVINIEAPHPNEFSQGMQKKEIFETVLCKLRFFFF